MAKQKAPSKEDIKQRDEREEKKAIEKSTISLRWFLLAGLIIVAVVIASIIFVQNRGPEQFLVNGFQFTQEQCTNEDVCWRTTINTNVGERVVRFYTDPRTANELPVSPGAVNRVLSMRENGSLVLTFDRDVPGEVGVPMVQFALVVGERLYNIPTRNAVYGEPFTCASSNDNLTVVYFRQAPVDAVILDDNGCVLVNAQDIDSLRTITDAFILRLLGITS